MKDQGSEFSVERMANVLTVFRGADITNGAVDPRVGVLGIDGCSTLK